jgi:isopropylmalate/homocitrate/citramalate synthase
MENKIIVVDQTIREGMQHRGIMFSYSQREKILEFQEKLNIDVCQAGYAPAHETEAQYIKQLNDYIKKSKFIIAVAGMGRATPKDAEILIKTGVTDFHLHFHIQKDIQKQEMFQTISESINCIRNSVRKCMISIAMLDIGRTSDSLIKEVIEYLSFNLCVDIISLPDTSGIMAPNRMFDKIYNACEITKGSGTKISTHTHNDMGMANANAVMGVCAGALVLEVSALGIGERNGIADLFTTAQTLKNQGFDLNVKTQDIGIFKDYYQYINSIYETQTGQSILNYNTPVFGDGTKSHVAGTHAVSSFGLRDDEEFFINVLCGTHLVEKYLLKENIVFNKDNLKKITDKLKSESVRLKRRVYKKEIIEIVKIYG